jgi:opine dehydrogenase
LKIAVLGGGNGSFAAAGDFALSGHEVRLWRRDADQVAAHRAAGARILVKDHNGGHDVKLALVTAAIAEADPLSRPRLRAAGYCAPACSAPAG